MNNLIVEIQKVPTEKLVLRYTSVFDSSASELIDVYISLLVSFTSADVDCRCRLGTRSREWENMKAWRQPRKRSGSCRV